MHPNEDEIKDLMTGVACAGCGTTYHRSGVEVLGHRSDLWFLRVRCEGCDSSGLVAAILKPTGSSSTAVEMSPPTPREVSQRLDRAPAPGPISTTEVARMRDFLDTFDGDFKTLFGDDESRSSRPAA